MAGKWREAPVEGALVRCSRTFVFHRHPQVHRERFRCERANLCNHVFDLFRHQVERAKRSESPEVGDCCCQSLRGKTAERTLNDRIVNPEFLRQAVPIPRASRQADTSKITSSSIPTPMRRLSTP